MTWALLLVLYLLTKVDNVPRKTSGRPRSKLPVGKPIRLPVSRQLQEVGTIIIREASLKEAIALRKPYKWFVSWADGKAHIYRYR